ncbi:DUF1360 domain-containing protein [Nocardioides sp. cx-173]|uniref:DUF1360 domain-containing protein n=1 Tax=Nocardioides sp. cx-173 TaxID=2898796 RepID=UPI001E28E472|nr:DUF1360 domain-containing protein [Nocardioides sp. cx-173]MCD4524135.1 DUF1360 domain-containing protein [Nocardioides sp. cx-173]UGB41531.1 DUF1360 domain-containing protein [Nocardioides sp. cx-173]
MTLLSDLLDGVTALHRGDSAYDPDDQVHLTGFAGSLTAYGTAVASLVAVARAGGHEAPERYALSDLAVGGLATHKLTRLLSRSSVASPLRAPFTRFEEAAGSGEHVEAPRGHGVRHTVGELLTCPFCLGVWVATGYVAGLTLAPRATRAAAAVLSVTATSDVLQHAYARLRGD